MPDDPATPSCPFCGEPHPVFLKDPEDFDRDPYAPPEDDEEQLYPHPECEHFIGRYDTDGGFHEDPAWYAAMDEPEPADYYSGRLYFLNELKLAPIVAEDQDRPEQAVLEAAFGDHLETARAVYDEWESPGEPSGLLRALVDEFGVKTIEISGGSGPMNSWISYDYYAPDPEALLERLRRDAKAVEEGVRALKG